MLLGLPSLLFAQDDLLIERSEGPKGEISTASGPIQVTEGTHVVRPGETLETITARYLGSGRLWRENWSLNEAEIGDPNLIRPGQRIRVWLRSLPADGALLSKTSNRVEDKLLPLDWAEANVNDLLRTNDNIRTFEEASAELLFPDETEVQLSENSLVILGEDDQPQESVQRTEIEVAVGQADLSRHGGPTAPSSEIEIVIGDAVATPTVDDQGVLSTRARKVESKAQLMVYTGASELTAGGQQVQVDEGMGSTVDEGEAPSPPEALLPAATGLDPAPGGEVMEPRTLFQWQPVDGAVSYTVEVCQDAACGRLLARQTGLTETRWRSGELPYADLYWRVTATSASGLDGYPTSAAKLGVREVTDTLAPIAEWVVDGPRARRGERQIVGPGFTLEARAEDGDSGVDSKTLTINGEPASEADLAGPWATGDHTVKMVVVDRAGNETEAELGFTYDDVPPTVSWGLQGVGLFGSGLEQLFAEAGTPVTRRGPQTFDVAGRGFAADSDYTQVILVPTGRKLRLAGADVPMTRERGLWLLFEDEVCGVVENLRYDVVDRAGSGSDRVPVVVAQATDCVGNPIRIAWPLEIGRKY